VGGITEPALRQDPFDRPLDALLERMRRHGIAYRPDLGALDVWLATCPVCGGSLALRLVERGMGGPVAITCVNGCHESRVFAALAAAPRKDAEAAS
jgi:hypothetical protein